MKRRDFMTAAIAGLGLGLTGLTATQAKAQRAQLRPIAIASANTPFGMMVSRVYPARGRNFLLMIRTPTGGDIWFRLPNPEGAPAALRDALRAGRLEGSIGGQGGAASDFTATLRRIDGGVGFNLRAGFLDGEIDGGATVDPTDPSDPPPQALGPWGALVAIVAMLVGLAAYAIHEGRGVRMHLEYRGLAAGIEVTPGEPPSDGVMADPVCETMPPMLC